MVQNLNYEFLKDKEQDSTKMKWDIIIVGAGIAGSAFAYTQGQHGRRILCIEKDLSRPNRIVGELLQPGGVNALKRIGLGKAVEDIDSQEVYGYALFKDDRCGKLDYPSNCQIKNEGNIGRSFHHGNFVQNLRKYAQEHETVTFKEGTVKCLINENGEEFKKGERVCGVKYKDNENQIQIEKSHFTVVCDGMYSSLRKNFLDKTTIKHPSHFIGIILKDIKLPYPNYGHVILAKPSPILFYPISTTEIRCLVDYPGDKLPKGKIYEYLRETVAEQVPEILKESFLKAIENNDYKSVRNSQLAAQLQNVTGAVVLGDAYNMRHPLTGGGMTVAIRDCELLMNLLSSIQLSDVKDVSKCLSTFYEERKPYSSTINTLANALYEVFLFKEGNDAHQAMRSSCYDYLFAGSMFSNGPLSLLSGLNPRPSVLIIHFFMVAFFGIGQQMQHPYPSKLWLSVRLLADAVSIIAPIVKDEGLSMIWSEFRNKSVY